MSSPARTSSCARARRTPCSRRSGDRSVLLLDGSEHLRQRRLLLPPFHGERMRAYEEIMRDATNRAIDRWPVGRPFALRPEMQAITLDVIVRAVFGVEQADDARELKARL